MRPAEDDVARRRCSGRRTAATSAPTPRSCARSHRWCAASPGRAAPGSAPDVCEDIVQETLLAIHQKRHTWREDMAVRPWLYAIVRYKVVDAFRARGRRVQLPIDDFADVLPAEAGRRPDRARRRRAGHRPARRALGAHRAGDRARGRQHRRDLRGARHDRDRGAGGAAPGAEEARAAAREDDRMRTEQLIQAMAADTERPRPVGGGAAGRRCSVAALVVAAVFLLLVGPRPDLAEALMQAARPGQAGLPDPAGARRLRRGAAPGPARRAARALGAGARRRAGRCSPWRWLASSWCCPPPPGCRR